MKTSVQVFAINLLIIFTFVSLSYSQQSASGRWCGIYHVDPFRVSNRQFNYEPFPWMVALYHGYELLCGGTIVSSKIAVIAAHCIQEKGERYPQYEPFNTYLIAEKRGGTHKILDIENFIIHPDWNVARKSYDADIALTVLKQPLRFTRTILPACLPLQSSNSKRSIGLHGAIGGWAENDVDDQQQYALLDDPKLIKMKIDQDENCISSGGYLRNIMSSRTFCSAGNNGPGLCKGDSGSGFIIWKEQRFTLRGVVSAALSGSCRGDKSIVFTDVAQFSKWIQYYINYYK